MTRKLLFLALLALSACSATDPYQRAGVWTPSGAVNANIAAQVANPADLARGRGDPPGTVRTATTAVQRLWQPPQGAQQNSPGQGGQQQAGGAAQRPGGGEQQR